jgi:ATP-dependent Clp protease ATP-binding subunit ClpC
MFPPSGSAGSGSQQEEPGLHDLLGQCATNLTEKAARGELPAAYERDQEVEQILTSLASPLKGRIVITGGARVGKTAIIQEAAARIQSGNCPEALRESELWALSARSILRAFGVQGWQDRLGRLMEKWAQNPDVILYVDALPTIHMAGATAEDPFDMAQFLLGQLQSSSNRVLAEGRTQAVRSFLEIHPEYKHVLMEVKVGEPSVGDAHRITRQASQDLEASQNVVITEEAIQAAIDLTRRFALGECLPGKAIDLIGEGIALQSERKDTSPRVTQADIIARFGEKTGLPSMLLSDDEPYDEEAVRRQFSDRVLGQEQAVDAVVQALSLLRTRLNNPNRPMGVFLFMGPTGVGKTELARALAQFLFGSDELIVRFNMADYTQDWDAQTLFGNPSGFDMESRRGVFTTRLQDHAFAVILLDEFEKAHPEVFQRFLQLFDEGILQNSMSETLNLRNAILILTSNYGTHVLSGGRLGFGPAASLEEREQHIREEMVQFFTPELINRIDSVCFFKPLTKPVLREIAYRRVQEILQREGLVRRRLEVEVDEDVIEWVVEHGYSERYGARYLARQIEKTITYPLAQQLIRNDPPDGSLLRLFVHNERVASALILPPTSLPLEEAAPAVSPDSRQVLKRLTPDHLRAALPTLHERVAALEALYDLADTRSRLSDLLRAMATPSFWDDPQDLQPRLATLERLSSQLDLLDRLKRNLDELAGFVERMGDGKTGGSDLLGEAQLRYRHLMSELPHAELTLLFGHPWDAYGAYLHIEAQGEREVAFEWVSELGHMYLKWAAGRDSQASVISETLTDAGKTRALWLKVAGYGAYGLLRGESGVHRLVQANPQDGRRQIARAVVSAWPDLPDRELPEYDPRLVVVKKRRLDGAGVFNKQLSAQVDVRLGDDQHALRLAGSLPADTLAQEAIRLLRVMAVAGVLPPGEASEPPQGETVRAEETVRAKGTVRAYVRYKQRYARDPRTGVRSDDLDATLNGKIEAFLEAYLRQVVNGKPQNP